MPPKKRGQAQAEAEHDGPAPVVEPVRELVPGSRRVDRERVQKVSDFTSDDEQQTGSLTTIVDVQEMPRYGTWISRLEVTLRLRLRGPREGLRRPVEAGYIVGFALNRATETFERRVAGRVQFVDELMVRNTLNDDPVTDEPDPTDELRHVLRMLYTKRGTPRKKGLQEYQEALSENSLVFIDTFQLYRAYRGIGLSDIAIRDFRELIAQYLETRTVLLSPARSEGSDWGHLTNVEVERKLIGIYGRNGYEVWIQGSEDEEGSTTVMVRTLDNAYESEDESDDEEV